MYITKATRIPHPLWLPVPFAFKRPGFEFKLSRSKALSAMTVHLDSVAGLEESRIVRQSHCAMSMADLACQGGWPRDDGQSKQPTSRHTVILCCTTYRHSIGACYSQDNDAMGYEFDPYIHNHPYILPKEGRTTLGLWLESWCRKILLVNIYGVMGSKHGVLCSKTCAEIIT